MKRRPACRQSGKFAGDGRPVCGHGEPMYFFGRGWHCAVRIRERAAARYATDPEPIRERQRRYKAENRELIAQRERDRYDPEQRRERNARRIRVLGIYVGTVGFTASETEALVNGTTQ